MFRKTQGEPLKPDHAFAFCRASFLMTFAMGGIPHAGSQQARVLRSDLQGEKTSEPQPGQAGSGAPTSWQPLLCSISSEVSELGE